jgi:hypothetical protein
MTCNVFQKLFSKGERQLQGLYFQAVDLSFQNMYTHSPSNLAGV